MGRERCGVEGEKGEEEEEASNHLGMVRGWRDGRMKLHLGLVKEPGTEAA